MLNNPPKVTLAIGGHDPCGGAGIQADIEAIAALGGHATSAITCLTVQDTLNVQQLIPVEPDLVIAQAKAVLDDLAVSTIKIGLIGSATLAQALAQLLAEHPSIPVVLDPVLAAGGGAVLADSELQRTMINHLLPRVNLLTPNSHEARHLAGTSNLDECAQILLHHGCKQVLITGTHEEAPAVTNTLYSSDSASTSWEWERLPGEYHGSGCTLAAAIAALLAQGLSLTDAVRKGQEYTWQTLAHGQQPGRGQTLPSRLYRLAAEHENT
ncbi:Hydroxymethylpyrimidine phosphate kinase ThiD [hydrothermal vent metagenome]|uniref:Hydroxymethylpyrimidine phosphate kinase ThiD n=1 Tax=hydrothermal vent metagenome TaxID=652676 RepID=A0A3B1B7A6_9ZZZZ